MRGSFIGFVRPILRPQTLQHDSASPLLSMRVVVSGQSPRTASWAGQQGPGPTPPLELATRTKQCAARSRAERHERHLGPQRRHLRLHHLLGHLKAPQQPALEAHRRQPRLDQRRVLGGRGGRGQLQNGKRQPLSTLHLVLLWRRSQRSAWPHCCQPGPFSPAMPPSPLRAAPARGRPGRRASCVRRQRLRRPGTAHGVRAGIAPRRRCPAAEDQGAMAAAAAA